MTLCSDLRNLTFDFVFFSDLRVPVRQRRLHPHPRAHRRRLRAALGEGLARGPQGGHHGEGEAKKDAKLGLKRCQISVALTLSTNIFGDVWFSLTLH